MIPLPPLTKSMSPLHNSGVVSGLSLSPVVLLKHTASNCASVSAFSMFRSSLITTEKAPVLSPMICNTLSQKGTELCLNPSQRLITSSRRGWAGLTTASAGMAASIF